MSSSMQEARQEMRDGTYERELLGSLGYPPVVTNGEGDEWVSDNADLYGGVWS